MLLFTKSWTELENDLKVQFKAIFSSEMNLVIDLNLQEELESWEDEVDGFDSSRKVIEYASRLLYIFRQQNGI